MRRVFGPRNRTGSLFLFLAITACFASSALASTPAWVKAFDAATASGTAGVDYPAGLQYATAVYDKDSNRLIVYGGLGPDSVSSDVWALDSANKIGETPHWTKVTPSSGSAPAGRWMHIAAYDPDLKAMMVFGGKKADSTCLSDV